MPTVLLVRHGRTTANTGGILAGWTPGIALDELGTEQARALGRRVAAADVRVCRVVSSPLRRCRQTAEALRDCLDEATREAEAPTHVTVELDRRLGECQYGAWTGRPIVELVKEPLWRTVQDHPSAAAFPDDPSWPGESLAAMQHRAVSAVREVDAHVRADHGEQGVWVAVSHGDVIKAILADALGVHLDLFQRIHVDPGSLSVVSYTERRPFVLRTNDVGGELRALAAGATPSGDAVVGGGSGSGSGTEPTDVGDELADGGSPTHVG